MKYINKNLIIEKVKVENLAKVNTTNMTNGAITIAHSGSGAGDIDTCEPTAANNVNEGDYIAIATNGGSTGTHSAHFTIVVRR